MITASCTITFLDSYKVEHQQNLHLKDSDLKEILQTEDVHTVVQTNANLLFNRLWDEWLKQDNKGLIKSVSFSLDYAELP